MKSELLPKIGEAEVFGALPEGSPSSAEKPPRILLQRNAAISENPADLVVATFGTLSNLNRRPNHSRSANGY